MNGCRRLGGAAIPLSLAFVLITAALLMVTAGGLYARLRTNLRLRNELTATRQELAELAILHPLQQELLQARPREAWPALKFPPHQPLARSAIVDIPDRFAKAASGCGLMLGAVSPHIGKNGEEDRQLQVDVQASGSYAQTRDFLLAVMAWPCFIRIDQMELKEAQMQQDLRLRVWLALD